jgi:Mitochondrial carrier protein
MSAVTREMMAAGPACAIANGVLNSFETTKVKLQLHNNNNTNTSKISNSSKSTIAIYRNPTPWGVMTQIAAEEGIVRGLMLPGLSASLTRRSCLYGAYRVGLYSTFRDAVRSDPSQEPTLRDRIASGMVTGGIGSMISCPLDVIRTRLQADAGKICPVRQNVYLTGLRQGQSVRYRGMWSAWYTICQTEGLRQGLYRGASVTVARASLLNGSQLASYDTLKHAMLSSSSSSSSSSSKSSSADDDNVLRHEGPMLHVFCAMVSGIIAQTVVMPMDTVKSHMMIGNGWRSVVDCIRQQHNNNNKYNNSRSIISWFYRGYLPACAGQGLIMVLQMPLIEEFRRRLSLQPI